MLSDETITATARSLCGTDWDRIGRVAQDLFRRDATRILEASGLPADLQAAQERAERAEGELEAETHKRNYFAVEAGVTGEWRRRALEAEAVIEKARTRKKGVLVQMYDDDIERLTGERDEAVEARSVWLETATAAKAERDQLASQLQEARGLVEKLIPWAKRVGLELCIAGPPIDKAQRWLEATQP